MIWVLYAIESLAVSAAGCAVAAGAAWVWHQPLWAPAMAVGLGFAIRMGRGSLTLVSGWHGAVRRRIEER